MIVPKGIFLFNLTTMDQKIIEFNRKSRDNKNPDFHAGDIVKVYRKVKEAGKERIQVFEGLVIAVSAKQSSSPKITVRKVTSGVGVELIVPINSPEVDKIELVKRAIVRRAKLYYVRTKSAKGMRMKYKEIGQFAASEEEKVESTVEANEEDKKESKEEEKAK